MRLDCDSELVRRLQFGLIRRTWLGIYCLGWMVAKGKNKNVVLRPT